MERVERNGVIGGSVRTLDLRNVKENAADARRRIAAERRTAVVTMGNPTLRSSLLPIPGGGPSVYAANAAAAAASYNTTGRPSTAGATASYRNSQSSSSSPPQQQSSSFTSTSTAAAAIAASNYASSSSSSSASSFRNTSSSTADSLAAAAASAAVVEVAQLHAKVGQLEDALEKLCRQFTSTVNTNVSNTTTTTTTADTTSISSTNTQSNSSQFYAVSFGPGAIGMILTASDEGSIDVAELRDDKEGKKPLLAKASGMISVGDSVIAINHHVLSRFGPPTLEAVASEFKGSPRPVTVLFKRRG